MGWRCARCGQAHEGPPLDWAFDAPIYWDGPRWPDDFLTDDLCVWRDDDGNPSFFIRGVLPIPIVGSDDEFMYGVWCSLSEKSFDRIVELYDDPRRVDEPPYFGWLSNSLPGYPPTLNLAANVVTNELELRPVITLHGGDHPLIREQREGITLERVREIAEHNLHPP